MKGFAVFVDKEDETFYLTRKQELGLDTFHLSKNFLECFLFKDYSCAKEIIIKLSKKEYPFKEGYSYKTVFVDCILEPLETYIGSQLGTNDEDHLVTNNF